MPVQVEQFGNLAQTTLNGSVNSSATSIVVSSTVGFPAKTQFRIGIDQEIMLVTAVSGTTWTVTRGLEGTTPASHSIGSTVQNIFTAGMMQKLYNHSLGKYNFFEFMPADIKNIAEISDDLNTAMLLAQQEYFNLSDKSLDDITPATCVDFYYPRNKAYLDKTVVVPRGVRLHATGKLSRDSRPGHYANSQTPTFIIPTGAHLHELSLLCNVGGGNVQGNGVVIGKNWNLSSSVLPLINQAGTGHAVGDVLGFPNPDNGPYSGFKITVTSISGGGATGPMTGFTVTNGLAGAASTGAYALPPNLQTQQWTVANGFNDFVTGFGTFVPPLYPQISSTGTGTGVVLDTTSAWAGDWDNGNTYNAGKLLVGDCDIGRLRILGTGGSPVPFDNTFGYNWGVMFSGGNYVVDDISTNFMGCGILFAAIDLHMRHYNPVKCLTPFVFNGAGSVFIEQPVIDSCAWNGTIDNIEGLQIGSGNGRAFFATSNEGWTTPGGGQPATLMMGVNTSSNKLLTDLKIDLTLENAGAITPIAALSLQNIQNSKINLDVSNWNCETRAVTDYKINQWAIFGVNIDPSVKLTGKFDDGGTHIYAFSAIFGGTIPHCKMDIWDATVPLGALTSAVTIGGTVTTNNTVALTFTNTAIAGLPVTKTYTVQAGNTLANIATGIAAIINSDTTLTAGAISAVAVGAVLTITQNKIVAGNTVITAGLSGGATETVAFAPTGGMMVAAQYGATVSDDGLYNLNISGAPVPGLGLNKALTGSTAMDKASGTRYINTGTASSPSWH